jgi:hypothetical protein
MGMQHEQGRMGQTMDIFKITSKDEAWIPGSKYAYKDGLNTN